MTGQPAQESGRQGPQRDQDISKTVRRPVREDGPNHGRR